MIRPTWVKGAFLLGESKHGFMISDHNDSSLLQKGRSDKGSFAMTTSRSCVPRVEKNRRNIYKPTLILGAKRRRKSYVNYIWIYEIYIFLVWDTNVCPGLKQNRIQVRDHKIVIVNCKVTPIIFFPVTRKISVSRRYKSTKKWQVRG